jgi:hypothetical protein
VGDQLGYLCDVSRNPEVANDDLVVPVTVVRVTRHTPLKLQNWLHFTCLAQKQKTKRNEAKGAEEQRRSVSEDLDSFIVLFEGVNYDHGS